MIVSRFPFFFEIRKLAHMVPSAPAAFAAPSKRGAWGGTQHAASPPVRPKFTTFFLPVCPSFSWILLQVVGVYELNFILLAAFLRSESQRCSFATNNKNLALPC